MKRKFFGLLLALALVLPATTVSASTCIERCITRYSNFVASCNGNQPCVDDFLEKEGQCIDSCQEGNEGNLPYYN